MSGESGGSAIELSAVRREYDRIVALEDVSLRIQPGALHCLVGPNGSGKTTLFRIILGLTDPTAGTVRRPSASIGVGFQRPVFYPDLTVSENLRVFGRLLDAPTGDWRETVRQRLGLDRVAHRRAGALSGGYGKKLDLALALLDRPQFLLLDEPLTDLDDVSCQQLLQFLDSYAEAGNAVFVSTHRVEDFAAHLDRLTVLQSGAVICDRDRAALPTEDGAVRSLYEEFLESSETRH